MPCWICGAAETTAEHIVKASDIRQYFGKSPDALFWHTEARKNNKAQSVTSRPLKYKPSICHECNSTRTQPYDRAWEKLSKWLFNHRDLIKPGRKIKINKIFSGRVAIPITDIQLYFAKLTGCLAVDYQAPIDVSGFADALLSRTPLKNLTFELIANQDRPRLVEVGRTPLFLDKQLGFSMWIYHLHHYSVLITVEGDRFRYASGRHPVSAAKAPRIVRLGQL